MSPYLFAFFVWIWGELLSPPFHWVLSLSLEAKIELLLLPILVLFSDPIIENFFVGRELFSEWKQEEKRRREWYRVAAMEPEEFRDYTASFRQRAERQQRLAGRLVGRGGGPLATRILRRAAWRREQRARIEHNEADRLETLWRAVEKEREKSNAHEARARVLQLMRRLTSPDERTARGAFAEIRRLSNSFDWESLVPGEMTQPHREKLMKLLRLMAGTTSLDEARSAYHNAVRMLNENGWSGRWEAA